MREGPLCVHSLDELRTFVHQTLCAQEQLLPEQCPLSEVPLMRSCRPCGIQFFVQGPRAVRLSAIWASELNIVFFYDATGERFLRLPLRYRLQSNAA